MTNSLLETLKALSDENSKAFQARQTTLAETADYLWRMYTSLYRMIEATKMCAAMEDVIKENPSSEATANAWRYFSLGSTPLHIAPELNLENTSALLSSDYMPPWKFKPGEETPLYPENKDPKVEEALRAEPNATPKRRKKIKAKNRQKDSTATMAGDPTLMLDHFLKFHAIYTALAENPAFRPNYETRLSLNMLSLVERALAWMYDESTTIIERRDRHIGRVRGTKERGDQTEAEIIATFKKLHKTKNFKSINHAAEEIRKHKIEQAGEAPRGWSRTNIRRILSSHPDIKALLK